MGAGIVMGFILIGIIFAAGLKAGLFLRLLALFAISVPILYRFMQPHQKERFAAFLHPDNLAINATYQVYQAKVAIGSGGFLGKGFREGTIKASKLLPVQESDFIFPVICEEFGLLGGVIVLVLYAILIARIWLTIAKATELFGALIAVGFMCMFGFQFFENIGMTMGIMPVTGITLPFLSAGGSSVLVNMLALGIILGINFRDTSRSIRYQ
jgi:rod shape determining protein RodA